MKYFYMLIALAGLCLLLIPALLLYLGRIDAESMKNLMFVGTLLWFSGAIPWLGKKNTQT